MAARLRRRAAWVALARTFKPGTPGLGRRVSAIPRMIRASVRGEYDGGVRLALMLGAGAYIVSPIDAIPEAFTFIFGLVDDAFVATWFAGALMSETERFLDWERQKRNVVPGSVVGGIRGR